MTTTIISDSWISADHVFDGQVVLVQHAIRLSGGRVAEIVQLSKAPHGIQHVKGMLCPGFVDLQVNGGGGVMLNSTPTVAGILTMAKAHRQLGTVAVMPTVITDHPDVLQKAADAAIAAKAKIGIVGLHIEGPHISVTRRGTHAAEFVRPMERQTLDAVSRLRKADIAVMITVAPEAVTPEQILTLTGMGAVVSIGHTDCTAVGAQIAIAAGARCGTHLFNAMSPMLARAPGAVGALISSDCYTGIICDGHHVADEMVGLAVRARPVPDRMFLVSDAMATVGGPDAFSLYGQTVTLENGRLLNSEGSLAGAHVTQAEGLRRLVECCGVDVETALRMVTSNPANCIGMSELGRLAARDAADIIILDHTLGFAGNLNDQLASSLSAHVAD